MNMLIKKASEGPGDGSLAPAADVTGDNVL